MTAFLTDEWFAMAATEADALPEIEGLDANLMLEIAGAPSGKLRATAIIEAGRITQLTPGKTPGAECTVVAPADFMGAIIRGDADAEVAYMRGDVKLDKAYERVLFDLRPLFASEPWAAFLARVATATDFS